MPTCKPWLCTAVTEAKKWLQWDRSALAGRVLPGPWCPASCAKAGPEGNTLSGQPAQLLEGAWHLGVISTLPFDFLMSLSALKYLGFLHLLNTQSGEKKNTWKNLRKSDPTGSAVHCDFQLRCSQCNSSASGAWNLFFFTEDDKNSAKRCFPLGMYIHNSADFRD